MNTYTKLCWYAWNNKEEFWWIGFWWNGLFTGVAIPKNLKKMYKVYKDIKMNY